MSAGTPASKSGTYTTLGRASSTTVNAPNTTAPQVSDKTQQQRSVSAVSSCASGAEADTERDTSIDESDEVGEISEALTLADCVNVGLPVEEAVEAKGKTGEAARSASPATIKKNDKTGRNSPIIRSVTPASTANATTSSESPRTGVNSTVKASSPASAVPHSVQGYDGGNVGVLGGGVKLGGGPSASSNNSSGTAGKHDQSGRNVSGQSTGRSTGQIRSASGSSVFAATGSESETTIGSDGGKASLSLGNKKRRGRPQQSRSPDVGHSRSRESISHSLSHPHHWSPITPSRMHPSPTLGTVPSPKGQMGMGMLGGGIAGQPGAVGYGPPAGVYNQAYPGGQQWAQMPVGGLGMPMPSAPVQTSASGAALGFSNMGRLSPTATTGSRTHAAQHLPVHSGGIPGQPGSIGAPIAQVDNSTWRGYQHTMHAGPR